MIIALSKDFEVAAGSEEDFRKHIASEARKWLLAIRTAGVRLE